MIEMKELNEEEALKAIELGDFSAEVVNSAAHVIIILTQSWCPDWRAQRREIASLPGTHDLQVYFLEYDRKKFGHQFMTFKETVLRNGLIPYLRFYRNGEFCMDSNYSSTRVISQWLEQAQ